MYQYIILKNVVANYSHDEYIRGLLSDILRLRFSSYRSHYGYQSIPTDLFDFIGTHLVITKNIDGKQKAILSYRIVSKSDCDYYDQDFPYIEHMHTTKTDEELHIIEKAKLFIFRYKDIAYLNAYAVDPDLPSSEKREIIKRGLAFYGQYIEDELNNRVIITAVTDKFKVYRDFFNMGFEYITGDHRTSTFTAPHIMGEKFRSMVLQKQSSYATNIKNLYLDDFRQAITVFCEEPKREIA